MYTSVLSSNCVGSRNPSQIISRGSKCLLKPLIILTDLIFKTKLKLKKINSKEIKSLHIASSAYLLFGVYESLS